MLQLFAVVKAFHQTEKKDKNKSCTEDADFDKNEQSFNEQGTASWRLICLDYVICCRDTSEKGTLM